jgi:hypothetical protein
MICAEKIKLRGMKDIISMFSHENDISQDKSTNNVIVRR